MIDNETMVPTTTSPEDETEALEAGFNYITDDSDPAVNAIYDSDDSEIVIDDRCFINGRIYKKFEDIPQHLTMSFHISFNIT